VTSYRQTALLADRRPGYITAVVFSADGRYLATTGTSMGGLAIWDLSTRQLLPPNYTTSEFTASFSPDSELLAFGGHDRLVVVLNVRTQRFVKTIRGHGDAVDAVRFLPDGRHLVSAGRDGTARLWSLDVSQGPTVIPSMPRAVEFSPDGRWLAIATESTVRLLDAATEREAAVMPIPSNSVGLAFAPDSRTLAVVDITGSVHVLSVPDGTATKVLPAASPLDMSIRSATVAFSPDGRRLAAADGDGNIRLWVVGTWEHSLLELRAGQIAAVTFSPDGRLLAIAGPGLRSAQVHDLARQRPQVQLTGHTRGTVWIGFTADGSRAITTSFDGTVRFWDPSSGRETAKIVRGGDLSSAVLTPDQRRLVVGGLGDSSLSIFDTATNDLLLTLPGHTGPISDIAVSPDGTVIASSSNDRSVRIWRAKQ
jgi:WD40 repeat protein